MMLENVEQLRIPAIRIISLVPSQTSLLHYLDLEEETVGITKFCIHPKKWKEEKQIIGGTKNISIEKIRKLNPDLIIANKEENVKEQIESLAQEYTVWMTDVNTLDQALQMIDDIGKLTGKEKKAAHLIHQIGQLQNDLLNEPPILNKKKIGYFIWKDPWMIAASGTFINDIMDLAGFSNYFATQERYPVVDLNSIEVSDLDAIFLSSEPYPFKEKHIKELKQIFPDTAIYLVDGEMFSWYGDHLLKSLPYLMELKGTVY